MSLLAARYARLCSLFVAVALVLPLQASPLISECPDDKPRQACGNWTFGGYFSVSPEGDWFSGISAGAEYFILPEFSLVPLISPGISPGYFYLSPSVDANYYLWRLDELELGMGYAWRYFYQWPFSAANAESSGTMHGPGVFVAYSLTRQFDAGLSVSYQFLRFAGELYREWYFSLPVNWYF